MTNPSRVLSFKLASLLEEYTEKEFYLAVSFLIDFQPKVRNVKILAPVINAMLAQDYSAHDSKPKPTRDVISRAVVELKISAPEKFQLLSAFDSQIRGGTVLSTNEELKRFGEKISKDFKFRKSRKESIGGLMRLLAQMTTNDIKNSIESAKSYSKSRDENEYQNLANFIIRGKSES